MHRVPLALIPMILAAGVLALPVRPARARRAPAGKAAAALSQLDQLNGAAIRAFEAYSFRQGLRKLQRAVKVARAAGLHRHKKLAQTYVLLGIGAIAGRNDLYRGLHYFARALRLNRKVGMPRKLLTPQVIQVFKSARKAVAAVGKPPTVKIARRKGRSRKRLSVVRKNARGLVHVPIDEARRGFPIPVKAAAGVDIRAASFTLYFRAAGTVKFSHAKMHRSRGAYRATIPARFAHGRYLHYYIEARDPRGRIAARNGSARGPNVVTLK